MIKGKKIVVVMPAYNAEATLTQTHQEVVEQEIVDLVIVVDDFSHDATLAVASKLPNTIVHRHPSNQGYGANQKTCYELALKNGADIVVMVHADYQYTPKLIPAMASMLASGLYHCALGSRILGGKAVRGGMPVWKYFSNRALTLMENLLTGAKLSEYHTGYRAFTREVLEKIPFRNNSDDFIFDNQMLIQILSLGYEIAEVTCPTRYFPEASSINFSRSLVYGLGCLSVAFEYRLFKMGLIKPKLFSQ